MKDCSFYLSAIGMFIPYVSIYMLLEMFYTEL